MRWWTRGFIWLSNIITSRRLRLANTCHRSWVFTVFRRVKKVYDVVVRCIKLRGQDCSSYETKRKPRRDHSREMAGSCATITIRSDDNPICLLELSGLSSDYQ